MTWDNLTLFQFQQLARLDLANATPDTQVKAVAICYGITEQEVDSWPVSLMRDKTRGLDFLNNVPIWEPKEYVEIGDKRYRFIYDIREIRAARYIEVKDMGKGDPVPALHRCLASMVIPQKKEKGKWVDDEYNAANHSDYAADMLEAPVTAVYGSALFFSKLYAHSTQALAGSLEMEGMTPEEERAARATLAASSSYLDGSTTYAWSPSTNGSHLSRRIASRLSSSSMTSRISKRKRTMKKNY